MNKDENTKKMLGQYYLDVSNKKNKRITYINVITKFINRSHYFSPVTHNYADIDRLFIDFARKNKYTILDINFFIRKKSKKLFEYGYFQNVNSVCVMADNNNKKFIFLIRNHKPDVIELSKSNVKKSTLIEIYNTFVYDIISYGTITREYKEKIKLLCESVKSNFFLDKINGYVYVFEITKVKGLSIQIMVHKISNEKDYFYRFFHRDLYNIVDLNQVLNVIHLKEKFSLSDIEHTQFYDEIKDKIISIFNEN